MRLTHGSTHELGNVGFQGFHGSARIGSPSMRIADVGGEELNEATRTVRIKREQLREHWPGREH
jgi:hypothetical protein